MPETAQSTPAEFTAAAIGTASRRVLIIDDNSDAAEAMALLVRAWGHEVATAMDAGTGLALLEPFAPDIVLLDIGLPDMDGYETARQLRADTRYRDLQLVAVTGYGRDEDRAAARAAGFDSHLVKPADMGKLQALLARRAREQA
jgi:two-component system CheB/CheR fusion protein